MRLACAICKTRTEDRAENASLQCEVSGMSAEFSSAIASVAQEDHNIRRRI